MNQKDRSFNHLRPSTTSEMLDRVYNVATRSALILWGAGFVYAADHLLPLAFQQFPKADTSNPYVVVGMLLLALVGDYAAALALLALFQGLIFPLRLLSPKALFRTAFRKLPGFFLTHLLYLFTLIILGTVVYGIFTSTDGLGGPYGRAAAGSVVAIISVWISIRLCLAPVVCLIEDTNPFFAFARSRILTSKRVATSHRRADYPILRWLSAAALPLAVLAALGACFAAYGYQFLGLRQQVIWKSTTVSSLLDVFAFAASWLAMPLYWAGLMAFYVEYRMRHEALDFYLRLRELRRKNGDDEETFGVRAG